MLRKALVTAAAVLAVGCGGPGSFNGTVDGKSLSVEDAVFAPIKSNNGDTVGVALALSDVPDMCAQIKANREPKGATVASFLLLRVGSDGNGLAPDVGEFKVTDSFEHTPQGNFAFGGFSKSDANCNNEIANDHSSAKSGVVKVDALELKKDGSLTGTFDVTFGTQADKVTGSFNAAFCDVSAISDTEPNCE